MLRSASYRASRNLRRDHARYLSKLVNLRSSSFRAYGTSVFLMSRVRLRKLHVTAEKAVGLGFWGLLAGLVWSSLGVETFLLV